MVARAEASRGTVCPFDNTEQGSLYGILDLNKASGTRTARKFYWSEKASLATLLIARAMTIIEEKSKSKWLRGLEFVIVRCTKIGLKENLFDGENDAIYAWFT
jgi:hypothetical protein